MGDLWKHMTVKELPWFQSFLHIMCLHVILVVNRISRGKLQNDDVQCIWNAKLYEWKLILYYT